MFVCEQRIAAPLGSTHLAPLLYRDADAREQVQLALLLGRQVHGEQVILVLQQLLEGSADLSRGGRGEGGGSLNQNIPVGTHHACKC